jgi:hypothetical protein
MIVVRNTATSPTNPGDGTGSGNCAVTNAMVLSLSCLISHKRPDAKISSLLIFFLQRDDLR